jgi:hypothetical protein
MIQRIAWDGSKMIVNFQNGSVYDYDASYAAFDCLREIHNAGESVGQYFIRNIKTNPAIQYRRIQ